MTDILKDSIDESPTPLPADEKLSGSEQLSELQLGIDAAKHLSNVHREAHLERRKLELRITFAPILVYFVATATILVRGDSIRSHAVNWVVFSVVAIVAVILVAATANYLRRMHDANIANRLFAEAAEDWLAERSCGVKWKEAQQRIPKGVKSLDTWPWLSWQIAGMASAALLLIGVLFIVTWRPQPVANSAQPQAKSLSLDGGGVKLEFLFDGSSPASAQRPAVLFEPAK